MRASEFSASHPDSLLSRFRSGKPDSTFPGNAPCARTTSGQRLDIRYDPRTNAIVFVEDDWTADGRGGATPRSAFREQLETPKIRRLARRRAA